MNAGIAGTTGAVALEGTENEKEEVLSVAGGLHVIGGILSGTEGNECILSFGLPYSSNSGLVSFVFMVVVGEVVVVAGAVAGIVTGVTAIGVETEGVDSKLNVCLDPKVGAGVVVGVFAEDEAKLNVGVEPKVGVDARLDVGMNVLIGVVKKLNVGVVAVVGPNDWVDDKLKVGVEVGWNVGVDMDGKLKLGSVLVAAGELNLVAGVDAK